MATTIMNGPQDPWDQPLAPPSETLTCPCPPHPLNYHSEPRPAPSGRSVKHVPDSWDDEEEEEEVGDPAKIWQEANKRLPMPEVLIQTGASSTPPPPAALQPKMSILKRPKQPLATPTVSNNALSSAESLKDKEARYREARERIFGQGTSDQRNDTAPSAPSPQPNDSTPNTGAAESAIPTSNRKN